MATNPIHRENMEMDDGDDPDEVGAESSYGLTYTAEDAAVRGVRNLVLLCNLLSAIAIAGASPSAAPGHGLLSSTNPALGVDQGCDVVISGLNSVDASRESLIVDEPMDQAPASSNEGKQEEDGTIACLQIVGVIPFILEVFTPRVSLQVKYGKGNELRNGDLLYLREISDAQA